MIKDSVRHGDIALVPIEKLPDGLIESKSKVLYRGSNNNDHAFDRGRWYPKIDGEFIIGYLVTQKTTLTHREHGNGNGRLKTCSLTDGIYEVRKQVEITHSSMRKVVD